jgi:hypothetical protein
MYTAPSVSPQIPKGLNAAAVAGIMRETPVLVVDDEGNPLPAKIEIMSFVLTNRTLWLPLSTMYKTPTLLIHTAFGRLSSADVALPPSPLKPPPDEFEATLVSILYSLQLMLLRHSINTDRRYTEYTLTIV